VATLVCPVRGCGAVLTRGERRLACARGHSFDLARSGYCNLLQPQDRRSRQPGDSPAAVAARRRLFDHGHGDWLLPHLHEAVASLGLPPEAAVLDVGCGEGFYLGSLAEHHGWEAHGLDISTAAVDLAARRWPGATWVVANADRFLPYAAGSCRLALCLTARLNPPELRRILAAAPAPAVGYLLIAVPGADDLVELRAAVLGEGVRRDRLAPAAAALAADFELIGQAVVRQRLHLSAADLHDLLAATYRGARTRQRDRAAGLAAMEVTASRELAWFRPRPRAGRLFG
jgi:23S rRNA (guanine745-N1)-methyltransferase